MPDQIFINERKRELLDLERELNERLSHDAEAERPGIDSAVGRLSFIDAHQQHQMDLNAQRRSTAQLASVRAALERIQKETYGICQRCGVEILPSVSNTCLTLPSVPRATSRKSRKSPGCSGTRQSSEVDLRPPRKSGRLPLRPVPEVWATSATFWVQDGFGRGIIGFAS